MKPVAILQHAAQDGPGHFSTFLAERGVPVRLIRVDLGESVPADPTAFSGLGFLGGPMSVNDPLPWIEPELALIRRSIDAGVPVIGHCLGGQLMAKALGAPVVANPVWEIGWGAMQVADHAQARHWFGDTRAFLSFHWHGETFALPERGTLLASSEHCENQAFALGRHLGMQCHVEVTEAIIQSWIETGEDRLESRSSPAVQTASEIRASLTERVAALRAVASGLYERWIEGLRH